MQKATIWKNNEVDSDHLTEILASGKWDALNDIDGFFAGVYKGNQKTFLFCDRLGVYPLFYCTHNDRLFAAPSMAELLDTIPFDPTPSIEGVLSLLLFGHHLADETVFKEIHRCQGGQVIKYSHDTSEISPTKWRKPHTYSSDSENAIEVRLADAFVRGVEKAVAGKEKIIIPLSGGFDSRAVLGAALECTEADRIYAVTFGGEDALDFKIGQMVAKKAGVKSIAFPIADQIFDESFQRRRARDYAYGYSAFATQPQEMIDYLDQEMLAGHPTIWGVGGDAITGSHLRASDFALKPCETFEDWARLLVNKRAYLPLKDVVTLLGLDEHEAICLIGGLLERSTLDYYEKPWRFLDAWDIFVRGTRETISVLPFSGQLWRCPHLSREYFHLMATQCFDAKIHQNVYRRMLASRYRSLFSLPSKRGRPVVLPHGWQDLCSAVGWAAGRVKDKALRGVAGHRDPGAYRNYGRDQNFLASIKGQERLNRSLEVLIQQGVIRQDKGKAFDLARSNAQIARILITFGYAFEYN